MSTSNRRFARQKSLPKPNYLLHQVDNVYFVTLWIMTNVSLILSGVAGVVFMRRTLKIATFTEIYVCARKLVEDREQYKEVAAALMANAPPSISQVALVYFAVYFVFVFLLWIYMNLRMIRHCIIRLMNKAKED